MPCESGSAAAQQDSGAAGPEAAREVLPRAEALASARSAVRHSRARRAARTPENDDTVPLTAGLPPVAARPRGARTDAPATRPGDDGSGGGQARERPPAPGPPGERRGFVRPVRDLRERLPLWLRLRCGVEPRTLLALAVVLLAAVAFAVHHFWTGRPEAVRAPEPRSAPALPEADGAGEGDAADGRRTGGATGGAGKRLVVDVSGKVRKPGIYRLPSGARVADALESAGGVRPGTDVSGLNRARRLIDGEQIVAGGAPAAGGAGKGAAAGPAPGAGAGPAGGTVSLNSATAQQLETLPGVGPVLAQRIVDHRQKSGGFSSVDQLQDVSGIGERRFADIKPKVTP